MDRDEVQRIKDSLKYFEDKKKLQEREDLDSLSNFFRSMTIRPTSEELEKPIAIDDSIERQLENTPGVGRELTEEELYQNLSQQQPEETTVEDFGGVTKAIEEAKKRTAGEPKIEPLGTATVTPTEQQIIDANTPRLGDEIDLIKKRESVGDTNYLQEGKTETKNVEEKDTVPTISQMYPRGTDLIKLYESQNKSGKPYLKAYKDPSTGKFTIGFGNIMIDGRPVKEGDVITDSKAIQLFNESLKESIDELNNLKSFLPEGVKFSKGFETALISILHNSSPDKIKYTPKKRNETRAFKALKKGDLRAFSKELFDPKVGLVSAGGKIRKGLVKRRQEELQFLDPSERYDIKQQQSGGMIESDPYKKQPRFI